MTKNANGAYDQASAEHKKLVDKLLAETKANKGLASVDLKQFWADQKIAGADPFGKQIPQVAFGASCTHECVFDELGVKVDWWRQKEDEAWALDLNKRYNDLSEKIVGRRLLNEKPKDSSRQWPAVKQLYDIFEASNVWEGGADGSWWLKQSANTVEELAALLDRVEKRLENLREFLLPDNWEAEKKRLLSLGCKAPLYRSQRGPCTFACSIFGVENMLFLYYDDQGLMKRFSDVLKRAILGRALALDEEAGFTAETAPRGWYWADDNCCLFTPEMYELFAMPIHRAVFARYSPEPKNRRFQHSDSNMAHLLPLMSELDFTGTNFGPTLTVREIRQYCPNAVIEGQMAPFTYSRNEEANMVAEFLRDFEQAGEKRGLNFSTAGSVNNGSRLTGMRLLMAAVQRYGKYG
jgi:uroporphyrinogen decarboxylase